jgi:DNA invertase Pin-like site-specific DNA recombinase
MARIVLPASLNECRSHARPGVWVRFLDVAAPKHSDRGKGPQKMTTYGYARVSTDGQMRQDVWRDRIRCQTDRAALAKLIKKLAVLATVAERQAGFKSLSDQSADTTTPHGRLMLTVLGGLAEFERELIRARTAEGRKRATAANGETLTDIARTFGVSHTTISRFTAR